MRQKLADPCAIKSSLVYKSSSRTARAVTQKNPTSTSLQKYVPYYILGTALGTDIQEISEQKKKAKKKKKKENPSHSVGGK